MQYESIYRILPRSESEDFYQTCLDDAGIKFPKLDLAMTMIELPNGYAKWIYGKDAGKADLKGLREDFEKKTKKGVL